MKLRDRIERLEAETVAAPRLVVVCGGRDEHDDILRQHRVHTAASDVVVAINKPAPAPSWVRVDGKLQERAA